MKSTSSMTKLFVRVVATVASTEIEVPEVADTKPIVSIGSVGGGNFRP